MIVIEAQDPELHDRVQELNLLRQYDLLASCVEIGLKQAHTALDKYVIWALNDVAVANLSQFGGRFRQEPVYVGDHIPPHFKDVPELMDRFLSTIHENWFDWSATELAAYGLWPMASCLDPSVRGRQRPDGQGRLLLPPLRPLRRVVARAKNRAGTHT